MDPAKQSNAYQIHIWIQRISPMIWRRLLIRSDSTIADLHRYIQIVMGWSDFYLHQFKIYGKTYGISHSGSTFFSDDATTISLDSFGFQPRERFSYQYNFFDNWELQVRVEKLLLINPRIKYPRCIGGSRAAPPEDCGGVSAFMQLENHYSPWRIQESLIEILRNNHSEEKVDLEELIYWINRNNFDRQSVNHKMQELEEMVNNKEIYSCK